MNAAGRRRQVAPPSPPAGVVNWSSLDMSDSDDSKPAKRRRTRARDDSDDDMISGDGNEPDDASDDEVELSDDSQPAGRRSSRLTTKRKSNYFQKELIELDEDESDRPRRRGPRRAIRQPTRSSTRATQRPKSRTVDSSPEPEASGARRSERTRTQPRRSMRERQEDEISDHSEEEVGPKIVGAKEIFYRIPESDPFRKRHCQECESCAFHGDSADKGPLIYCQGCTVSYHKSCLRGRSTRDHLVTKVGEALFVLQCSRCIGHAHELRHSHPHYGICTVCHDYGALSQPLRAKLTTKQEQQQREENGGKDPITITDPSLINNIANVMFRCAQCKRAWHMHHLPDRKNVTNDDEDDEELNEEQLAQKRFDLYHRSWTCKDCIENQAQIDAIVAWRPVNIEKYQPGVSPEAIPEADKEYLIKWKAQSYLRTKWMPGDWVFGLATYQRVSTFNKKPENAVPKLTTKDAIPEDYLRIDIVFDVRYTSFVRNSTKEIDLARVKEVDMAYVKYKGLGFEDAIWEKPPRYDEGDRWNDFKSAYEDYVLKLHVTIPAQSSLRRHLLSIRQQDFESQLMRKTQPSWMTGGQIMQYQMEGLNWLYYQWFDNQNAILADEMGLGKTIQIIAFFSLLIQEHKCWPFLVVVPNSTCPNWRREIKTWNPSLRVVTYYGNAVSRKLTHDYELFPKDKDKDDDKSKSKKRPEAKDIKAHIIVTSYESIVEEKTRQSLMRVPWQGLVVDEGQRLKNEKNQLYDCLQKYFRFPFKVLLTGTPLQNNVRELFNLLQFLDKSVNAAEMEAKYANLTEENVPELHDKLRKFFLRRTKAQVLTFLPPMAQIIVPVTMSALQKKVYRSILARNPHLMKAIFSREGPTATKERVNLNNILMLLRRTLCHPFVYSSQIEERSNDTRIAHRNLVEASSKLQLLSIMLPKLQERGHRVLMFSQFLENLTIMEDFLDGLGLQHRRLDGQTSSLEKQKRIDEFNAPGSPYFAFLLSTRAGGVGINLATADTVLILDPDFNPHQDIQALSRAHRIGQKNKVLVFQLMTRGSVEEKIMQVGKRKMALDHVLIERMDQDDDAGMDLESILRHGAEALFKEDSKEEDIIYDSTSVDRLLDRSQAEDTKTSDDKSAESQFSFARIWANDKNALEEKLATEEETGVNSPDPSFWEKILELREKEQADEDARNAQALGRGKRKRQNVDYGGDGLGDGEGVSPLKGPEKAGGDDEGSDTDFQDRGAETTDVDETGEDTDTASIKQPTIRARPFKRAKVPMGDAPHFNGEGSYVPMGNIPPIHHCSACDERHPMGWCRLKIAGVEHCGLCGLAHLGHSRTCPHLRSETQVATLLQMLKESPEEQHLKDSATKYLRMIRGDLARQRAVQEREAERAKMEAARAVQGYDMNAGVNGYHAGGMVNGNVNGGYGPAPSG
jgi:chromodomain-helicase-DNA-binding protein 4